MAEYPVTTESGTRTTGKVSISDGGGVTQETADGAVNGVNKVFVFSAPPFAVFYQGILQSNSGADYTLVGSTATFVVAPVSGLVQGLVSA